ncbi:MAG: kelch repeat-containing protein [Acidobacteriota bacterium]
MNQRLRSLATAWIALASASLAHSSPYWKKGPSAPVGLDSRKNHAMAYDSTRNLAILFGGTSGTTLKNDTWEYDGTVWTLGPAAPGALVPRSGHAMVYDSTRNVAVLFGGQGASGYLKDVWEYNGLGWVAGVPAPAGIVARSAHAMAFDTARNTTVLFGGINGATRFNDTWEYDGLAWTAGPVAPPALTARAYHTMAFYPPADVTVLFGGLDTSNRNDTWIYDGTAWVAGPPPGGGMTARRSMAMAYDAKQGRIVLFGGFDGANTFSDTWIFSGAAWTLGATAPASLDPRADFAMCKTQNGKVVLFGGNGSSQFKDTWEYKGAIIDYVLGEGLGFPNPNRVRVYTANAVATSVDFYAYAAGQYGTNVDAGSIDDAVDSDILTGPGPGGVYGPQVRAWFATGSPVSKVNFYAYGTLKFGVNVTTGKVDPDAYGEIITGPGPGVVFGPTVRGFNFDATTVTAIAKINYNAYSVLQYGVNVTTGEVDNDGFDEILTGQGPGAAFPPEIRGWNFDNTSIAAISGIDFNAYATVRAGVRVDSGGDVDNDNFDEILSAPGPDATLPARFLGFDYDNTAITAAVGFDVTAFTSMYGGRVSHGEVTGDAKADLLAAAGPDPGANSLVQAYKYNGTTLNAAFPNVIPFGANAYGTNPASGALGYF